MKKFICLFSILAVVLLSSCSAKEEDIVGKWYCSVSSEYDKEQVEIIFKSDKTGEMIVYTGSDLTSLDFTWNIDGYMVYIDGKYLSLSDLDDDEYSQKEFSTKFRYKDGKLVSEGFVPGAKFYVGSTKTNLTFSKL